MAVRGIRGAIAVRQDEAGAILEATQELLLAILAANPGLEPADIGSVFFTLTEDLAATYPAQAARDLGWGQVPLLCGREIPVPDGLPRCLRVLIHWNTDLPQHAIQHVYLGEAACLRPDVNGNHLQEERH
jgi:chorismate mutase